MITIIMAGLIAALGELLSNATGGQMSTDMQTMTTSINNIDNTLQTIYSNFGGHFANFETVGAQIASNVTAVSDSVTGVKDELTAIETDASNINGNVGNVYSELQQFKADFDYLSALPNILTGISQMVTALNTIQPALDGGTSNSVAKSTDDISAQLTTINNNIVNLWGTTNTDIQNLQTAMVSGFSGATTPLNSIATNTGAVNTSLGALSTTNSELDGIWTAINGKQSSNVVAGESLIQQAIGQIQLTTQVDFAPLTSELHGDATELYNQLVLLTSALNAGSSLSIAQTLQSGSGVSLGQIMSGLGPILSSMESGITATGNGLTNSVDGGFAYDFRNTILQIQAWGGFKVPQLAATDGTNVGDLWESTFTADTNYAPAPPTKHSVLMDIRDQIRAVSFNTPVFQLASDSTEVVEVMWGNQQNWPPLP